jgi:anti-sigma regulatory factor (Ser/Thr protein kinase)
MPPCKTTTLVGLHDLKRARHLLEARARWYSAVSSQVIDQLIIAVHEVAANGLVHGRPPVRITLWPDVDRLTCLVEDSGHEYVDPMTGFRCPNDEWEHMGLWAARQLVDDLFIENTPTGGSRVLLIAA